MYESGLLIALEAFNRYMFKKNQAEADRNRKKSVQKD